MSAHLVIMVKKLFQFECIFLGHLLLAAVVTAKNHYLELCKENCTSVDCKPSEEDFTQVFTPNCGVELPTFSTITGHIVSCQSKYLEPLLAFPHVLAIDKKSDLSLLRNKSHTKVGLGMVGFRKKSFWCVLFRSGQTNSTFVLEARGIGIKQKKGCYSGSSLPCNGVQKTSTALFFSIMSPTLTYIFLLQQW